MKNSYWKYATIAIVVFSVIEGIRYGRGVDYLHYCDVYNYDLEESQLIFSSINDILKKIGITAEGSFLFYAIPFICSSMLFMKPMKQYASYLFPFFIVATIILHEAFVRQFLAMSIVFLYLVYLFKDSQGALTISKSKKLVLLLVLALVAYGIHSVAILTIVGITFLFIFFSKPFPWYLTIPVLLVGKFVISEVFDWSLIEPFLDVISSNDVKFAQYADNADMWFSDDALKSKYTRNVLISIFEVMGYCATFYLGPKVCNYIAQEEDRISANRYGTHRIYISIFNSFIVGSVILLTFFNLELVRRVSYGWQLFWFVPVSLILYYRKTSCFNNTDRIIMYLLFFWLWDYYRFLTVAPEQTMFIWDR